MDRMGDKLGGGGVDEEQWGRLEARLAEEREERQRVEKERRKTEKDQQKVEEERQARLARIESALLVLTERTHQS